MANEFYALMGRMRYITRWGLMRNTFSENIQEHSHQVAVLAHALALIRRDILKLEGPDPDRCAVAALYHDASEILTGDMPTPVKYYNPAIREAYRQVEQSACDKLIEMLPSDLQEEYDALIRPQDTDSEEMRLVKAADKISALIKCIEETSQGNREFLSARRATEAAIRKMAIPAADEFLEQYIPAYELTLDDQ